MNPQTLKVAWVLGMQWDPWAVLGPLLGLTLAAAVLALVAVGLKRYWNRQQESSTADHELFSLDELRQLRDTGQISEAEYTRAQQALHQRLGLDIEAPDRITSGKEETSASSEASDPPATDERENDADDNEQTGGDSASKSR